MTISNQRTADDYSEDTLVEQPAIALFVELGWQTANCFDEVFGADGDLGRETPSEVVLLLRLREALRRLNPDLSATAIALAIEELTRERGAMSIAQANREVYKLIKDGVRVTHRDDDGIETTEVVRVIDWEEPANNDFFLASQLWVAGEMYTRRPDLIGFVNGLPLALIELKASHRRLKAAYDNNLRDYKKAIPQLFWYNALIILSNGSQSKVGSLTAEWEHFAEWKKINSEGEQGIVSLETMLRGTCQPERLLDIVENFILFKGTEGEPDKLLAKNHQYLGVNNAIEAVRSIRENQGRLGVFWHTQGSGKSYSMVFFSQKILRKQPGNWTFVVVTDREDLDNQIYGNFANTGLVLEAEERIRAQDGEHLKQLLREDHRYVFTLIQKFHTRDGGRYPKLSDRSDIIVMTDEAHRSQYDTLALNMRNALPDAAYLAFTGTPLLAGEEKTRAVFGDYVSIYNFRQSIEDGNTVPLYYENRIPEVQLTNAQFNEDMQRIIEAAELDDEQEEKLEREFAREYHLITRDDRLEKIAEDIVLHFMGRQQRGKAMVISIDKATAVRMYDKVQKHWKMQLAYLTGDLDNADPFERIDLEAKIRYMEETDMAVVVSQSQNEVEDLARKGADIVPHRKRMLKEDLEIKFKDTEDPFRIVFVCAMWMTGFDAKACSTIYLDKPMRNHTLMQTIARANRVFGEKVNGLIVDYIGVFRNLQQALAIYGTASGGDVQEGDLPVEAKAAQVALLRKTIEEVRAFCVERGVDIDTIVNSAGFEKVRLLDDAAKLLVDAQFEDVLDDSVEKIIVNDELKRRFVLLAANVNRLFKAILPYPSANEFSADRKLFMVMSDKIRSFSDETDITEVMEAVEALLDKSVAAKGYVIREPRATVDLSQIDFDALKAQFAKGRKRIEAEKLRGMLNSKLGQLVRLNKSRVNYLEEFQRLIDEYNAGSRNVEDFFNQLVTLAQRLNAEEQRHIAEKLSEEELAVFDLLTRPDMKLSKKEMTQVKKVAHELLETLKQQKLVLDWRKRQQSRAAVRLSIELVLEQLPERYTTDVYRQKCDAVYQHVYDAYYGSGRSVYV